MCAEKWVIPLELFRYKSFLFSPDWRRICDQQLFSASAPERCCWMTNFLGNSLTEQLANSQAMESQLFVALESEFHLWSLLQSTQDYILRIHRKNVRSYAPRMQRRTGEDRENIMKSSSQNWQSLSHAFCWHRNWKEKNNECRNFLMRMHMLH